jgi:hypothetical protein
VLVLVPRKVIFTVVISPIDSSWDIFRSDEFPRSGLSVDLTVREEG